MKLKLLTIALITVFTVILWVFVTFSGEHSTNISIPVNVIRMPEDYILNSLTHKEINLSLKGEGWQLAQISFGNNPVLNVPVSDQKRLQSVPVRTALGQSSWLSSGLQIVAVNPEQIEFTIEKIDSKVVKIVHDMSVDLKPGYGFVSSINISPDTVRIFGAKSRIDTISEVNTEHVIFKEVDQFTSSAITLKHLPNVILNSDTCRIQFDVQKIVDKKFENVLIETIEVPGGIELSLYPSEVKVIIRGGINNLGNFLREDFKLYVNFKDALADTTGIVIPQIELPEYFYLNDIRPDKISYIIKQY